MANMDNIFQIVVGACRGCSLWVSQSCGGSGTPASDDRSRGRGLRCGACLSSAVDAISTAAVTSTAAAEQEVMAALPIDAPRKDDAEWARRPLCSGHEDSVVKPLKRRFDGKTTGSFDVLVPNRKKVIEITCCSSFPGWSRSQPMSWQVAATPGVTRRRQQPILLQPHDQGHRQQRSASTPAVKVEYWSAERNRVSTAAQVDDHARQGQIKVLVMFGRELERSSPGRALRPEREISKKKGLPGRCRAGSLSRHRDHGFSRPRERPRPGRAKYSS